MFSGNVIQSQSLSPPSTNEYLLVRFAPVKCWENPMNGEGRGGLACDRPAFYTGGRGELPGGSHPALILGNNNYR